MAAQGTVETGRCASSNNNGGGGGGNHFATRQECFSASVDLVVAAEAVTLSATIPISSGPENSRCSYLSEIRKQ